MGDLIDLRRSKLALTPEEQRFEDLVFEMRQFPVSALISALIAARDVHEFAEIVEQLAALIIYSTKQK
jgi:hypothetical protein